jgi:signal peptidase II
MTKIGRTAILLLVISMTAGCDHVAKHFAAKSLKESPTKSFLCDTVRLEYAENTGGMLSVGADLKPATHVIVFKIGIGLVLFAMAIVAIKSPMTIWPLIGFSLACAGGASNWIDRVTHGSVIDFVNIGIGDLRTGIFNVADIVIFLGIAILMITYRQPKEDIKV